MIFSENHKAVFTNQWGISIEACDHRADIGIRSCHKFRNTVDSVITLFFYYYLRRAELPQT